MIEVVEALRGKTDEVLVTGIVFRQQNQMIPVQLPLKILLVGLHADDGLLPGGIHGIVVLHKPVEVAVVGQSPGVFRVLHHVTDSQDAVLERVVAVAVDVSEPDHAHIFVVIDDALVVVQTQLRVRHRHGLFQKRLTVPEGPAVRPAFRPAVLIFTSMKITPF